MAPSPLPVGGNHRDVGQKDFGPPIVQATPPPQTLVGIMVAPSPTPATNPTPTPTACEGTIPMYMGVQNRGSTVFRLNQYSLPGIVAAKNQMSPPQPYIPFDGASQPAELTTEQEASVPGANVLSNVSFITAGGPEILQAPSGTGGREGKIFTISGAGGTGQSFQPAGLAIDSQWQSAGYGARDRDGNVPTSAIRSPMWWP